MEATEEVLETLEAKTKVHDEDSGEGLESLENRNNVDEEEKENICDSNVEKEPICDKDCESSEKISDLSSSNPASSLLIDEVADRRNLAEIKIQ